MLTSPAPRIRSVKLELEEEAAKQARRFRQLPFSDDLAINAYRSQNYRLLTTTPGAEARRQHFGRIRPVPQSPTFDPLGKGGAFQRLLQRDSGIARPGEKQPAVKPCVQRRKSNAMPVMPPHSATVPPPSTHHSSRRAVHGWVPNKRPHPLQANRDLLAKSGSSPRTCATAMPNTRLRRGLHTVTPFEWTPVPEAPIRQFRSKLAGQRTAGGSRMQQVAIAAFKSLDKASDAEPSSTGWGRLRKGGSAGKSAEKGKLSLTDEFNMLMHDCKYCERSITPRDKRQEQFDKFSGIPLHDVHTPRVKSWFGHMKAVPQMIHFNPEKQLEQRYEQECLQQRARHVVQGAKESDAAVVMQIILYRLLYRHTCLHVLQIWLRNWGSNETGHMNFARAIKATRSLTKTRSVLLMWQNRNTLRVIRCWCKHVGLSNKNDQLSAQVAACIKRTDEMLSALQQAVRMTHPDRDSTSPLVYLKMRSVFSAHPSVCPRFAKWLMAGSGVVFKRFEIEVASGLNPAGLRAAAAAFVEQDGGAPAAAVAEKAPAVASGRTVKERNKGCRRKWSTLVDYMLWRIGWPQQKSISSHFVQFTLGSLDPAQSPAFQQLSMSVAQVLFAHRLVNGSALYNKKSQKTKKPLSKEQTRKARTLFAKFDLDSSGSLDFMEVVKCLSCLGIKCTIEQVKRALRPKDQNDDGQIDFWEFTEMIEWDMCHINQLRDERHEPITST